MAKGPWWPSACHLVTPGLCHERVAPGARFAPPLAGEHCSHPHPIAGAVLLPCHSGPQPVRVRPAQSIPPLDDGPAIPPATFSRPEGASEDQVGVDGLSSSVTSVDGLSSLVPSFPLVPSPSWSLVCHWSLHPHQRLQDLVRAGCPRAVMDRAP